MSKSHLNYFICALTIIATLACSSCKTPKDIVYFQDVTMQTVAPVSSKVLTVKPNDKLLIVVNAKDPIVADMFNLPYMSRYVGQSSTRYTQNQGALAYTVNAAGDIDFPFLGEIHVAGMSRPEVAGLIKGMLIAGDYIKDPSVTVEIQNAGVSVLGEVRTPGRYAIDRDDMTILDALGMAGDLNIQAERESVKVLRTENGEQKTYIVNLLSADEVRNSPAYYLQQEDVIYVEPNPTRIRQSQLNANTILTPSFWISIATLATTVTAIAIR